MSFHRVGYSRRKRAPSKKRPEWDDTVHDLTVHKATPEEVYLRKEAHKSKNHMSIKLEKLRKEKQKCVLTGAEAHQLAIIKEVLYDQEQLQHVLAKSDTMMSVVKDLFGDDPKRFMGFPNVTSAPHQSDPNGTNSLVASIPDIYTRTEKLSDSVMDQSALNDIESGSDSDYGEVKRPNPISFESKMDLKRFQEYLQEEERRARYMEAPSSLVSQLDGNQSKSQYSLDRDTSHLSFGTTEPPSFSTVHSQFQSGESQRDITQDAKIMAALMAVAAANNAMPGHITPPRNQKSPPLPFEKSPPSAMNDTQKVKRSKCTTKSHNDSVSSTSNMTDLKKVLQDLENDISTYEMQTGRAPQEDFKKTSTFSGYTTALVSAVSRLTRYLKETDLRLQTEITLREQLMQDVYQLKSVIDALSTDLIVTQEEYGKLYSEHQRYRENTEKEITSINVQLSALTQCVKGEKMQSNHKLQQDLKKLQNYQRQQAHESANISSSSRKSEESRTSTPVLDQQIKNIHSSCVDGLPVTQLQKPVESSSTAAVLLSPPVRKTRIHSRPDVRSNNNNNNKGQKLSSQRQSSLIDLAQLSSNDPPRLTQAPPVMNTVSVPRPVPLVQSNMNVTLAAKPNLLPGGEGEILGDGQRFTDHREGLQKPLPLNDLADLVRLGDETEQQIQQLQELAVEETMNNPAMQSLMQTQIAELNRQQEEAKRRLLDLLDNQRLQHLRLQEQYDPALTDQDFPHSYAEQNVYNQQYHSKQQTTVSPPISPIPQQNERSNSRNSEQAMFQGNGIKISIPTIDLDSSRDSAG